MYLLMRAIKKENSLDVPSPSSLKCCDSFDEMRGCIYAVLFRFSDF